MKIKFKRVICYTDGSANWQNGLGGYGVYMKIEEGGILKKELFFNKGYSETKIGRMELRGMITALQKIKNKELTVFIYSDSQYVCNCINKGWMQTWERTGFKGVKNVDLIKQYLEEFRKFKFKPVVQHVRGHQTGEHEHIVGNNIADMLANYKQFEEYEIDLK